MDAVPAKTVLDPSEPAVDIKVTNRTGGEAKLVGWLNEEVARTTVPARSAIVTLRWPAMTEGRAKLKLSLVAEGVEDVEVHDVMVTSARYGYESRSPSPSSSVSKSPRPSSSVSKSVTPSPSRSKSKSPSPKPSVSSSTVTPSPSPSGELPKTGTEVRSYVVLGGGLLVFGLFVLALAWALGRRSASEAAANESAER